jgi:hypothetical protein
LRLLRNGRNTVFGFECPAQGSDIVPLLSVFVRIRAGGSPAIKTVKSAKKALQLGHFSFVTWCHGRIIPFHMRSAAPVLSET